MQQIGFLLQNLLFAQHVPDTIMPIIRSSRVMQMVAACGTWWFGLKVVGLVWSCGICVRFAGCCQHPANRRGCCVAKPEASTFTLRNPRVTETLVPTSNYRTRNYCTHLQLPYTKLLYPPPITIHETPVPTSNYRTHFPKIILKLSPPIDSFVKRQFPSPLTLPPQSRPSNIHKFLSSHPSYMLFLK